METDLVEKLRADATEFKRVAPRLTDIMSKAADEIERLRAGLEEIAFTPGRNREISAEDAAGVAVQLLEGWAAGTPATEAPDDEITSAQ